MNTENNHTVTSGTSSIEPWYRSKVGVFAGVCSAAAIRFQVDVMVIRLALLFSILFFGFGIGIYIIFAIGLPREDKLTHAYERRLLGVCSRFAQRFDLDVGLTRVAALTLLICSFGAAIFVYLILYFTLPKSEDLVASANRTSRHHSQKNTHTEKAHQ